MSRDKEGATAQRVTSGWGPLRPAGIVPTSGPALSKETRTGNVRRLGIVSLSALGIAGRWFGLIVPLFGMFATGAEASVSSVPVDGRLLFTVVRDGEPIGTHHFLFARNADRTTVLVRTDIDYRFLFLPLYRFRHSSKEVWSGGKLTELSSLTDDNGESIRIEARANGKELLVKGLEGEYRAGPGVVPSSLWNANVVRAKELLSTIRGKLLRTSAEFLGEEELMLNGRKVATDRYRITGQFERNVWYDRDSKVLVRVRFKASDGSWVEYVRNP